MKFTKMHGIGNDYVYVNTFAEKLPTDPVTLAVAVSDRHFGIGSDGLILIGPSERAACLSCGTPLGLDPFCSTCGEQRITTHDYSID